MRISPAMALGAIVLSSVYSFNAAASDDVVLPQYPSATVAFERETIKLGNRFAAYDTFCKTYQDACKDTDRPDEVIHLNEANWADIAAVHARVHSAMRTVEDFKKYPIDPKSKKAPDVWTYGEDGTGDCEDYANLWQRELIAAGFPASAVLKMLLSADEVETGTVNGSSVSFSQAHMVVLIRTDRGDFVADMQKQQILQINDIDKKWSIDLVESPHNETDFVKGSIQRGDPRVASRRTTTGLELNIR